MWRSPTPSSAARGRDIAPQRPTADEVRRHDGLRAVLEHARTIGALGTAPVENVIEHALAFVRALDATHGVVLDLGSGAGVPGLIVAAARPDLAVVLVDRRAARVDALARSIRRLGWDARVQAIEADAERLSDSDEHRGRYAAVMSRGFGPPAATLRAAAPFVAAGGRIIISEPPPGRTDRWQGLDLAEAGGPERLLTGPELLGAVAVFHVEHTPA